MTVINIAEYFANLSFPKRNATNINIEPNTINSWGIFSGNISIVINIDIGAADPNPSKTCK